MKQQEVSHIIISPPVSRLAEVVACNERFSDWLTKRFPRFTFEVVSLAPVQDNEHFLPIPVMSYKSPDGDMRMCKDMDKWVLAEIMVTCAEFEPKVSFAA